MPRQPVESLDSSLTSLDMVLEDVIELLVMSRSAQSSHVLTPSIHSIQRLQRFSEKASQDTTQWKQRVHGKTQLASSMFMSLSSPLTKARTQLIPGGEGPAV